MHEQVTNYCDACAENTLHVSGQRVGKPLGAASAYAEHWLYCEKCGSPNVELKTLDS